MRVRYPHIRVPGGFTRPTGDLDLQLSRRTDHVETWSPPYVFRNSVAAAIRSIRLAASGEHPSEENTETGGTFVKKLALLVAATATVALVVVAFAGAAETYTV